MRCKTCNYQLWNLPPGPCPECGHHFLPSRYEFRPNAVEYRCPHCAQPYYGTSETGHLEPRVFDCVSCHKHVGMDWMVLVPAPGVNPDDTVLDLQPWINRKQLGRRKAWWKTSVLGMFNPVRLAQCTPHDAPLWPAWKFTILNLLLVVCVTYGLIIAFGVLGMMLAFGASGSGGSGFGPSFIGIMLAVYGAIFAIGFLLQLLFIAVWIGIAHLVIRLTGGAPRPMRATSLSILYSSGAYLPTLVPCVNYISWLWWPISAGIALKDLQGVSAWRSVTATVLPPLLIAGALIGAYAGFIFWAVSLGPPIRVKTASMIQGSNTSLAISSSVRRTGAPPNHLLEMIADGSLDADDVIHAYTATTLSDVPVGDITLDEFILLTSEEQAAMAQAAADALPDDVVAHRLGDLVYTHHGFTPSTDFNLWVLIISPDPVANPFDLSIDESIWVVLSSGSVEQFDTMDFGDALDEQNALRADYDLAPLPDPADIQ